MNSRIAILSLTLAFSLALILQAGGASASSSHLELIQARWGDPLAEATAFPGARASLTAFVRFMPEERGFTALSLLASLKLPAPLTTAAGASVCYSWAPSMSYGEVKPFTFTFNIPPEAKPSEYTFTLRLSYKYVNAMGEIIESREEGFTFKLPIHQRTELLIEPETTFLTRGLTQGLRFKLACLGGSSLLITSLTVSSTSASVIKNNLTLPYILSPSSSVRVEVEVNVPDRAVPVDLSVKVAYLLHGLEKLSTYFFSLPTVEGLKPLIVEADSYRLPPDVSSIIKLKLTNISPRRIVNLTLNLSGQALSIMGSSKIVVEGVPARGFREVGVEVKPSGKVESYALIVHVSYAAEGMPYLDTFNLFFTRFVRPDLTLSLLDVSTPIGQVRIRGQVVNVGRAPASYVNLTAASDSIRFDRPTSYIGTLSPGEAASFLFTGVVDKPGVHSVTLKGFYADEDGLWFKVTREVQVVVKEVPAREKVEVLPLRELLLPIIIMAAGIFLTGLVIGRYALVRRRT